MTSAAAPEMGAVRGGRRARSQGVVLCTAMLRAAMVGANLALLSALGLGLVMAGTKGLLNAAVAGAMALVFFASGQGVQLIATQMADGTGMAVLLTSYLLRAAGMGLVLWLAIGHPALVEPLFHRGSFLVGAALVTVGWVAGVLVVGSRQRVYAYDGDFEASTKDGVRL